MGDERILQIVLRARDEASEVIKNAGEKVSGLGDAFKKNFKEAGLLSGAFIGTLGVLGKAAVENAASFEQNRIAFEAMLGSGEKAGQLLGKISDFAQRTPFELPQVVEGSKRLLAYNIEASKIIPTFQMLGDIAAGVGTDKLPQLITAFGQVQAKGKLMGQELLQFTEAGVGLGGALQKQFGVTRNELEKMISTGKIGASDVEKALQTMTSQGGLFFQQMEKQSKSFNGVMSNVNDSFGKFVREIVGINDKGEIREGSLFAALKVGAEKLLVVMEQIRPSVTSFFNAIANNKEALFAIAGALGGLLILAIGALIVAIGPALLMMAGFALAGAAIAIVVYKVWTAMQSWIPVIQNLWTIASNFFMNLPTMVGEAIMAVINWFAQLPTLAFSYWWDLYFVKIPYAVGFAIGWLQANIPLIVSNIIAWFSQLPDRALAIFNNVKTNIVNTITSAIAWLTAQLSALPGKVQAWIASIPEIAGNIFNQAKQAVINKMSEMFSGVSDWWGKIKGILESIVGLAEKAINAVKGAFSSGKSAGMSFADGGWVPRTGLAMVHAGEYVLSRGMLQGSQPIGAPINNYSQPINIGPVYVQDQGDIETLSQRLAYVMSTSGAL